MLSALLTWPRTTSPVKVSTFVEVMCSLGQCTIRRRGPFLRNVDILGLADPINIEVALFWCGTTSKISHAGRKKVDKIIPLKTC